MRIMTNYLQVLAAIFAFNIDFPDLMNDLFYTTNRFGTPSEAFLSFDCFIQDHHLHAFTDSVAYFKVFLTAILPIVLMLGAALIYTTLYFINRKYFCNVKRNIAISAIVILFVLHPTLTRYGLSVFECIEVDDGDDRSRVELDVKCFSFDHIKWCLAFGVPILVVWGAGIPAAALIVLFKNRKNLKSPRFRKYFLMIYQGYKEKVFYWELVNTGRKVFLLAINSFLLTYSLFYRGLFSVAAFMIVFRIQVYLQPYKLVDNNNLANLEIMTEMFTIFGGMLFVSPDDYVRRLNAIIFIMIIALNIRFILFWVYYMLNEFRGRFKICNKAAELLTFILLINDRYQGPINTEEENMKSSKHTKSNHEMKETPKPKKILKRAHKFKKASKLSEQIADVENLFQMSTSKKQLKGEPMMNDISSKSSSARRSIFENVHYNGKTRKPSSILRRNHEELKDSFVDKSSKRDTRDRTSIRLIQEADEDKPLAEPEQSVSIKQIPLIKSHKNALKKRPTHHVRLSEAEDKHITASPAFGKEAISKLGS